MTAICDCQSPVTVTGLRVYDLDAGTGWAAGWRIPNDGVRALHLLVVFYGTSMGDWLWTWKDSLQTDPKCLMNW